ncbi:MAG: chemotaxis response regulator protein-glutamate methylesterase [Polyangiaceae bacterium]
MIRVLVVDDSSFMRSAISRTLTASGLFEVVGQAKDGRDAVARVTELRPDVVSMDFNMPGMNGVDAVRAIMSARPTPIVMFSAHTLEGAAETLDALAAGAVDFLTKPAGEVSADLSKIQAELCRKLADAAGAKTSAPRPSRPRAVAPPIKAPPPSGRGAHTTTALSRLCVIAISTGGPAALTRILPDFPADTRFGIVVVQHMPAHFTRALADRLDLVCSLTVREAAPGDRPRPGLVLVAPGDRHLEFDSTGAVVLSDGPLLHGCRPAADLAMISAAKVYKQRAIGVVMTGMGKDGAAGARAIRSAEGRTLAQDEASSAIFGMPKAAIDAGAIEEVVPLEGIPAKLRYM